MSARAVRRALEMGRATMKILTHSLLDDMLSIQVLVVLHFYVAT
jgi:hypothetical protein